MCCRYRYICYCLLSSLVVLFQVAGQGIISVYQSCQRPANHGDVESSVAEDDSDESDEDDVDESDEPEGAAGLGDPPAPTKVLSFSILNFPCRIDVNY